MSSTWRRLEEDGHIKNCFGLIPLYINHLHIFAAAQPDKQIHTLHSHKYFSFILFMLLLLLLLCFVSCLSCVYVLNSHMIEITCMKLEHCTYAIRYIGGVRERDEFTYIKIFASFFFGTRFILAAKNFCVH